jgi:hypothetical protein
VQEVTQQSVQVAYVDQGYTGDDPQKDAGGKYQNPISFWLDIVDIKRTSRRSASTTTGPS